ncbi:MAG: S24 family peptidase [Arcobacteraceae bacterium]|jgi:hypothetical protein|nr:S24 family peptidase [Arcobacteraceae bacterium]
MDICTVLEKLKDIISKELGNKKIFDKDIANALGISYDNLRKYKSRNKIPYYEVMQFLAKRNISINWFFFGQLPEALIDSTSNYIILKYQKTITATAGGGGVNYQIDTSPVVVDKQLLDYINSSYKYTEVLNVFGDSMEPDIKDSSLIFVDISSVDIKNNSIYVISSPCGLYIKKVYIDNSKVILRSMNSNYQDEVFALEDIKVIGKVCGVLTRYK